MSAIEQSEKYSELVKALKEFYQTNGLSLETTAAMLDTLAVVLSRLAQDIRCGDTSLDSDAEHRNEAVQSRAAIGMKGRLGCPLCGNARLVDGFMMAKCPHCGDAKKILNWSWRYA